MISKYLQILINNNINHLTKILIFITYIFDDIANSHLAARKCHNDKKIVQLSVLGARD